MGKEPGVGAEEWSVTEASGARTSALVYETYAGRTRPTDDNSGVLVTTKSYWLSI